ncbi:MAG TPA: hypothetical protein VJM15_07965 [Sphingomicrobium sp.]|nr:hypothetical protein [Sphingomicrobium sp.]
MEEEHLATSRRAQPWTRLEDYFVALARRRTARRARAAGPRTQPDAPRFSLSTLPFLMLIAGLAVLAVAIAVAAWPGSRPPPKQEVAIHEEGRAAKGWLDEAKKEMRR